MKKVKYIVILAIPIITLAQYPIIESNQILKPDASQPFNTIDKTTAQLLLNSIESIQDSLGSEVLREPYDAFAIYSSGYTFIASADKALNRIVLVRIDMDSLQTNPSNCFLTTQYGLDTGDTQFSSPQGIVMDMNQNIYVSDTGNDRIVKLHYDSNLSINSVWTTSTSLDNPIGLDISSDGSFIWAASSGNNKIVKFNNSGTQLDSRGSYGSGIGQFDTPFDVDIINSSELLIADKNNGRVVYWNISTSNWQSCSFSNDDIVGIEHLGDEIFVTDLGRNLVHKLKSPNIYLASQYKSAPTGINAIPGMSEKLLLVENYSNEWKITINSAHLDICNLYSNSITDTLGTYHYTLTKSATVTEKVIDKNGNQIKMLNNNIQRQMSSDISGEWDLTDDYGTRVYNGKYWIEVISGDLERNDIINVIGGEGFLEVTSPNGNEQFSVGQVAHINWDSYNLKSYDKIKIEFSVDNGNNWMTIIDSTQNSLVYSWIVPDTTSDSCLIKISDAKDGDPMDISDEVFSIFNIYKNGVIIEAEHLNKIGYEPYYYEDASSNYVVQLSDIPEPGYLINYFILKEGIYDLFVQYFDENDGECTAEIYINNELQFTWVWDDVTVGNELIKINCGRYYISPWDVITLKITNDDQEMGKVDFIQYIRQPNNFWKGNLTTNTTWSATNSPYVLSGDLTINEGVTLEIESGSSLVFLKEDSLNNGTIPSRPELIINGNIELGDVNFKRLASDTLGLYAYFNSNVIFNDTSQIIFGTKSNLFFNSKLTVDDTAFIFISDNSFVRFQDSVFIKGMGKLTINDNSDAIFKKDCIVNQNCYLNIMDDCLVKCGANMLFYSQGRFWGHEATFEPDTTVPWLGIKIEGSSASSSYVSDCTIDGGIDGFIIKNSSPNIKLCTVKNCISRGFNIDGSNAQPVIERCHVHTCGNYAMQITFDADPIVYNNKLSSYSKAAIRIWSADGRFSRNSLRSTHKEGVYVYGTSSNPLFYAYNDDEDGNTIDLDLIGTHGVVIDGGVPEFGNYPLFEGSNIFSNHVPNSKYYVRNNTGSTAIFEWNWWPDGTNGAFYGNVDYSPILSSEPSNAGPSWKRNISPFENGLEKYKNKEYAQAFLELFSALQNFSDSPKADLALFKMIKAGLKTKKYTIVRNFLDHSIKTSNPSVQSQVRAWLMYFLAAGNEMEKAEQLAFQAPVGSFDERTALLSLISYYYSHDDTSNAARIAQILRMRHQDDDYLEFSLQSVFETKYDFSQCLIDDDSDKITNISQELESGVFPNPFNAATMIMFNLDRDENIKISVFDILGRHVKTLIDSKRPAGSHFVSWDGRDIKNDVVASGIYFIRIQKKNQTKVFKITFLK